MKTTNKFLAILALAMLICVSCNSGDASKQDGDTGGDDNVENKSDEIAGKWERNTAEGLYTLYLSVDGTGKLITYGHASSATYKFKYTTTEKGVEVEWSKIKKERYHAVLTVDGKYLVCDDGSTVYVYKKREK